MFQNVVTNDSNQVSDESKALYSRIMWRLLPLLSLGYFVAYLDRVNVGFAKVTMLSEVGMSQFSFGLGAGLFFIGYVLFEAPSNLILEKIGARAWLARIMISWGILSSLCMFVNQPWHFYVLRFLIGVAEAGFLPGVLYYLSLWFPSHRRGRIYSLFLLGLPLAGIFGGPISGFILDYFNDYMGLSGWRWLFLIEGIPAVILGGVLIAYLPSSPQRAKWLSTEEKSYILAALSEDDNGGHGSFLAGVKNLKVWLLGLIDFGILLTTYALAFWLPTLLMNAGIENAVNIGFYTAIPSIGALIGMVALGYSSDYYRERRWHLMGPFTVGIVAILLIPLFDNNVTGLIICATVASTFIIGAVPVFFSLPATFLSGPAAAAGFAIACSVANIAGLLSNTMMGISLDVTGSAATAMVPFAFFIALAILIVKSLPAELVNR